MKIPRNSNLLTNWNFSGPFGDTTKIGGSCHFALHVSRPCLVKKSIAFLSLKYKVDHAYTGSIQKIMRLFLQKMHNIWIQIFQFIFFKFSNASFKTNITFCYLAFKFWVFPQRIVQKCILRRLALVQVWLCISNTRIVLPNQKVNYSICIILIFTKFVFWAIVSLV